MSTKKSLTIAITDQFDKTKCTSVSNSSNEIGRGILVSDNIKSKSLDSVDDFDENISLKNIVTENNDIHLIIICVTVSLVIIALVSALIYFTTCKSRSHREAVDQNPMYGNTYYDNLRKDSNYDVGYNDETYSL